MIRGDEMSNKEYLARFRQGHGPMSMNAIDFYMDGSDIIMHSWAMGGSSKKVVDCVPQWIEDYELLNPLTNTEG